MESGIQSSFIPQDAAKPTRSPKPVQRGGLGELGLLVGVVLLVASGSLAGAVFLYEQYTISSSSSKSEQLRRAKEAFEPALIHELTRLDDRMRVADQILASHIAPLTLFDALQGATLATISYDSLSLEVSDSQNIQVKMEGVAQSVNSIALQADVYSKTGVLANPIFSDISRQVDGVHFNLNALVNPAAISYSRTLQSTGSPVQEAQQQQQQQTPFGAPPQGTPVQSPESQGSQPAQTQQSSGPTPAAQ